MDAETSEWERAALAGELGEGMKRIAELALQLKTERLKQEKLKTADSTEWE